MHPKIVFEKSTEKNDKSTILLVNKGLKRRQIHVDKCFNFGGGRKLDVDDPLNEFACFSGARSLHIWSDTRFFVLDVARKTFRDGFELTFCSFLEQFWY